MTVYADLFDLRERERIDLIGRTATDGHVVGFIVEDDAKADRYLAQLHERFKIRVVERGVGPVENTVFVKVGPLGH